ncbi:MAG: cation diffusion facilitator family transporter [Proteobacteria bacterium]|nr:cation diffusion facilitator family transporter [Pseudomonadota bacterium]
MAGGGKGAVFWAIVGNAFLTVVKFLAFLLSGSGALMSEAVHSFADTANQTLLYVGIRRSLRPADSTFHYGYGADRYVFALLSAMGIFVLGCGVTVYHGIHSLLHPPELSLSWITFAVLGISLVVDGVVFYKAIAEVRQNMGQQSFFRFVRESTDPTLLAVLFEDFVATLGVLIAMAGIGLAYWTGNPIYDSLSSIAIGLLLGLLAVWLGLRNRQLILGPAIPGDLHDAVLAYLNEQPSVDTVRGLRTRIVAADRFRIAAEVDYDGGHLARAHVDWVRERVTLLASDEDHADFAAEFGERLMRALGEEVDRIEAELQTRFPRIRDIDLESD